jgi:hypothetical protein
MTTPKPAPTWKRITKELPYRVLVTNNIKAKGNDERMSHLWLGFIIKASNPEKTGKFVTFDGNDILVHDITHYCEVPQP